MFYCPTLQNSQDFQSHIYQAQHIVIPCFHPFIGKLHRNNQAHQADIKKRADASQHQPSCLLMIVTSRLIIASLDLRVRPRSHGARDAVLHRNRLHRSRCTQRNRLLILQTLVGRSRTIYGIKDARPRRTHNLFELLLFDWKFCIISLAQVDYSVQIRLCHMLSPTEIEYLVVIFMESVFIP